VVEILRIEEPRPHSNELDTRRIGNGYLNEIN